MLRIEVPLRNKWGMHARLAYHFAKVSSGFNSRVTVSNHFASGDGKEMIDLLSLGAEPGSSLVIEAEGDDEAAAIDALKHFMDIKFNES